jgi:Ca2+-binding RTX toxin-like protein
MVSLDWLYSDTGLNFTLADASATTTLSDGTTITGVERISVSGSNTAADTIIGGGGNDTIYGYGGDDSLSGGGGKDHLLGGVGVDTLNGGSGNDTLSITYHEGPDVIDGGAGRDLAYIEWYSSATGLDFTLVDPSSTTTLPDGTTITGVEQVFVEGSGTAADTITGGNGNDTMYGGGGDDNLSGGGGNDHLEGGLDADTLKGGAGDDTIVIRPGQGADVVDGGAGSDVVDLDWTFSAVGIHVKFSGSSATATMPDGTTINNIERLEVYGSVFADDTVTGGKGDDRMYGDGGSDSLSGGDGNDRIYGGTDTDTLFGLKGDDTIDGNDHLAGGGGSDILKGDDGDDVLIGGAGVDKLTGGSGSDTFVFNTADSGKTKAAADTIYDFTSSDHIDLTHWDANSGKPGLQGFHFIGAHAFDGHAGELRYVKDASDTWIEGDANGDKKVDFLIHLDDAVAMKAAYFDL